LLLVRATANLTMNILTLNILTTDSNIYSISKSDWTLSVLTLKAPQSLALLSCQITQLVCSYANTFLSIIRKYYLNQPAIHRWEKNSSELAFITVTCYSIMQLWPHPAKMHISSSTTTNMVHTAQLSWYAIMMSKYWKSIVRHHLELKHTSQIHSVITISTVKFTMAKFNVPFYKARTL